MTPEQRRHWLAERRAGLGSSDAAAVLGLDPYKTALEVALDKWGLLPQKQGAPLTWGLKLEEVIAAAYQEETGNEAGPPPAASLWHPEAPWMFASLDRVVAGKKIVELKNARTAEGWGRMGTDEIPEHYLIQVQHQLHVGRAHGLEDRADVAVLIGGSDFRIYSISYYLHFAEALEQRLQWFWEKVQRKEMPEITRLDKPELVELLYRPEDGKKLLLDEAARRLVDEYQQLGIDLAALEARRHTLKTQLIEKMGQACEGHLSDGRFIRRRQITRCEYRVPETTYYDFRIMKGANGER
jgi:putative phage-type endonuclease